MHSCSQSLAIGPLKSHCYQENRGTTNLGEALEQCVKNDLRIWQLLYQHSTDGTGERRLRGTAVDVGVPNGSGCMVISMVAEESM